MPVLFRHLRRVIQRMYLSLCPSLVRRTRGFPLVPVVPHAEVVRGDSPLHVAVPCGGSMIDCECIV